MNLQGGYARSTRRARVANKFEHSRRCASPALRTWKQAHETVITASFQIAHCILTPDAPGGTGVNQEDTMNLGRTAISAAALCLIFGTTAALAGNEWSDCVQMSNQVRAAMQTNAQSPNLDAVKVERRDAADACIKGYYKLGIAHYKRALELLTQV